MQCPDCHGETSDMLNACEWCGAQLRAAGPPQYYPQMQPGPYTTPQPPTKNAAPWYATPWPYAAAIVLAVIVIGAMLFMHSSAGNSAYAGLVVNNQPTLLDIYTDS